MSSNESTPGPTPQDDADRVRFICSRCHIHFFRQSAFQIRLKRLAKLQSQVQSASSSSPNTNLPAPSSSPSTSPAPVQAPTPKPKPIPRPTSASVLAAAVSGASNAFNPKTPRPAAGLAKRKPIVVKFNLQSWEHETLLEVLKVTLDVR